MKTRKPHGCVFQMGKPLNNNLYYLAETIAEARRELQMKNRIIVKSQNFFYFIDPDNIFYCESDNCYTTIFSNRKKVVVSQSLTKFAKMLPLNQFIRVSQSYLVNSNYIFEIDKRKKLIHLIDGSTVPFTVTIKNLMLLIPESPDFLEAIA